MAEPTTKAEFMTLVPEEPKQEHKSEATVSDTVKENEEKPDDANVLPLQAEEPPVAAAVPESASQKEAIDEDSSKALVENENGEYLRLNKVTFLMQI